MQYSVELCVCVRSMRWPYSSRSAAGERAALCAAQVIAFERAVHRVAHRLLQSCEQIAVRATQSVRAVRVGEIVRFFPLTRSLLSASTLSLSLSLSLLCTVVHLQVHKEHVRCSCRCRHRQNCVSNGKIIIFHTYRSPVILSSARKLARVY